MEIFLSGCFIGVPCIGMYRHMLSLPTGIGVTASVILLTLTGVDHSVSHSRFARSLSLSVL